MICIIPQHATSVRLPRKGFRDICGIPLVGWSVIQAKSSHSIDKVYVSTESQEIAAICKPLGAEIIWRPDWLTEKKFAANVPMEHALQELGIIDKHVPFFSKLATSPLLMPDDMDRVAAVFESADDLPAGLHKCALLAAETQEQGIYKRMQWKEKAGRLLVMDKAHDTLLPIGGVALQYADEYANCNERAKWLYHRATVNDKDVDADMNFHGAMVGNGVFYYAECWQWQTAEIDDEQGLDLCRKMMEHYILNGRGPEVYYEYAERNK